MIKINDRYGIDIQVLVTDKDSGYVTDGTDVSEMMKIDGAENWNLIYYVIDLETGDYTDYGEPYYTTLEDACNLIKEISKRKVKIRFSDVVAYYETFEVTESEFQKLRCSDTSLKEVLGDRFSEERIRDGLVDDVVYGYYDIEEMEEVGV